MKRCERHTTAPEVFSQPRKCLGAFKVCPPGTSSVVRWLRLCFCCRSHRFNPWSGKLTLLHGAAKKSPSLPSDQQLCRTSQARVASPSQVRSTHGHHPDLTVPSCPCACLSHSPHTPQPWCLGTRASPGHCPHLTADTILVQPHDVQKCPCGRDQIWWAALPGSGPPGAMGSHQIPPTLPVLGTQTPDPLS